MKHRRVSVCVCYGEEKGEKKLKGMRWVRRHIKWEWVRCAIDGQRCKADRQMLLLLPARNYDAALSCAAGYPKVWTSQGKSTGKSIGKVKVAITFLNGRRCSKGASITKDTRHNTLGNSQTIRRSGLSKNCPGAQCHLWCYFTSGGMSAGLFISIIEQ